MDEDSFVADVRDQAGLATSEEAHDVIGIVLHGLAERLPDGWAHNLAAELPAEVAWPLRHGARTVHAYGPRRVNFVALVAERAGVGPTEADRLARAVFGAVRQACDPALLRRVCEPLTADVRSLIEAVPAAATVPAAAEPELEPALATT
jgi:uncharacterized protein (DUF2267 family)